MTSEEQPSADIEATLKKAAAALRAAGVPFLLGGSLASWARGGPETRHDVIARGEEMPVLSMQMRVMALEDVLITKLMAITEHHLRYESPLAIARALREQVDWAQVRTATASSPFARAFFVLLEGLEIVSPERDAPQAGVRPEPRVRVVTSAGSGSAAAG